MRYLILGLVMVLVMATTAQAGVKQEGQEFRVIFTITYNKLTLQQAAKIERAIRFENIDACKVKATIENLDFINDNTIYLQNDYIITPTNDIIIDSTNVTTIAE